ncbi:hypothetical protein A3F32_02955 [Candidatus Roizmanbacteria bacterium RIFCSPHIGHO2_12_FULL_42_10]|uniref:Uncharacterized protein n=1 Tax=Candidatus Roizmanbacteria bacterium RIFCSPHIGHO2_12_FULL_42_10 TaxID=1802053 RepID=A0A1F7I4J4_9BACT|nr:MAG: hypothetical protein A3F32_02955 [Candidatus Roizmanbacteria bacterium RIFCSPHIGHO2_12_FULL_42_10]
MKYQIDQSGKIEQTNINTVISCTNEKHASIMLKKAVKRQIQKVFRAAHMEKLFPYLTFSALIAMLIKHIAPRHKIITDREYTGHEEQIKERITVYCELLGMKNIPPIEFGHVGKTSKTHQFGYKVAIGKEKPTIITNAIEVLKLLFGTKKIGR